MLLSLALLPLYWVVFRLCSITVFPSDYRIPATVFIVALSLLVTGYTGAKLANKGSYENSYDPQPLYRTSDHGRNLPLLGQLFSI